MSFVCLLAALVSLGSSTLEVRFDAARKGAVSSVRVLQGGADAGVELVASACPLAAIDCFRVDNPVTVRRVTTAEAKTFEAKVSDATVTLVWREVGACVAEIRATVTAAPAETGVRWRLEAEPKPGWALHEIDYPQVNLTKDIGGDGADDRLVFGRVKGAVIANPGAAAGRIWQHGQPGELAAQFMTYYDGRLGFLLRSEDTLARKKAFRVLNRPEGLLFVHRRSFGQAARYVAAYDVVTEGLCSDGVDRLTWHDAADRYRAWAENQRWCRVKFRDRTDLPDWLKRGAAMVRFQFDDVETEERFMRQWVETYWRRRFPSVPLIVALWAWEKNGMWVAPDYFPPLNDEARFVALTQYLRAHGAHPFAWPSGYVWTRTYDERADGSFAYDSRAQFAREGLPHVCRHLNGEPVIWKRWWLKGGENAYLCGLDPWVRNWFNRDVCLPLAKDGCEMIQVDQVVGGSMYPCFAKDHGHGPGGYAEWGEYFRRQLETAKETMRSAMPQPVIGVEEPNEFYLDLVGIQDYRDCEADEPEWADVFNYLYHEYVPTFQSNIFRKGLWLAHGVVNGQMPVFRRDPRDVTAPDETYAAFMRRWIELYAGEARDFLLCGRAIKAPEVRCAKVQDEKVLWSGGKVVAARPAVVGAAWRAPDGREALVFANGTRERQLFIYNYRGQAQSLELAPLEIKIIQ